MSAAAQQQSDVSPPNPYVLANRLLRPGAELTDTSLYLDPIWRLEPAQLQQHERALSLNFNKFPPEMQGAAKRFAFTLLTEGAPGDGQISVSSVRKRVGEFRRLCLWLHAQQYRVDDIRPPQILAYQDYLRTVLPTGHAQHLSLAVVRMLWLYRDQLDAWGLDFDPRDVPDFGVIYTSKNRRLENRTHRIPEIVLGPLLRWALRFVDVFGDDIIAAKDRRGALPAEEDDTLTERSARTRLLRFLRAQEASGQPLPGFRGQPNTQRIAQLAKISRKTTLRNKELVYETAQIVGVDDAGYLDSPITGTMFDQPWTSGIGTQDSHEMAVSRLSRMLQTACYIVIAYLSGMRDSEIKHLQRGCLTVRHDEDGTPYRWLVTSLAFKGEQGPEGVPATWVIGEPAARAISILERLHAAEETWLLAPIPLGPGIGPASRTTNLAMGGTATINSLNEFISWVNAYCTTRGFDDALPDIDGRQWRLTTRQFRRTLAWFIARRPGGTIAGAIAYRHHSITMFEGYAGTSASGFRAEVEAEQALVRGEHLLDMIDQHQHRSATGPAAQELERRLDSLASATSAFGGNVVTDSRRLKRLLKTADPQVFPSKYVTCVYDPNKALCHRQSDEAPQPSTGRCAPLNCHNVALTDDNRTQWRQEINQLTETLASRPTLPPLLVHRLKQRQHDIGNLMSGTTRKSAP